MSEIPNLPLFKTHSTRRIQFATMSHKRRRVDTAHARRPIDKQIVVINKSQATAQSAGILFNAPFPTTVTGIRWEITTVYVGTVTPGFFHWAIILLPDGVAAAGALSFTDLTAFYQPEQHVLVWGIHSSPEADLSNGNTLTSSSGTTKTMRKMRIGDELLFICDANAATFEVQGAVQFFLKT